MPHLSVVVPTYNEGENIGPLLTALRGALAGVDTEFLVVDDASEDDTAVNAAAAGARTIVRTTERGLATAVVRGIEAATGTYVAVLDADFQHPVEAVARLLARAEETGADVVVGSRNAPGGGEEGFTRRRRFVSSGAGLIARGLLPPVRRFGLTDPMSGLFLVRRDRVDPAALRPRGYKILLEILQVADIRRVEEIGYVFARRRRGESKLGVLVMAQFLQHALLLSLRDATHRRALGLAAAWCAGLAASLGAFLVLDRFFGIPDLAAAIPALAAGAAVGFVTTAKRTGLPPLRSGLSRGFAVLLSVVMYVVFTRLAAFPDLAALASAVPIGGALALLVHLPGPRATRQARPEPPAPRPLVSESSRE